MKTPKSASYKWKFSPVNLMDRARFQDWLNQMARQGLFYHWYDGTLDLSEWFDEIAAMLTPEG